MLIYIIKKLFSFVLLLGLLSILCVGVIYCSPNNSLSHYNFLSLYCSFYDQLLFHPFVSFSLSPLSLIEIVTQILWPTFELCLLAISCAIIIGFPIGIMSGLTNNYKFNHLIRLVCLVLYASPIIWLAILVVSLFSRYDITWASIHHVHYASSMSHQSLLNLLLSSNSHKWQIMLVKLGQLSVPVFILTIQPCIITIQLISESVNRIANKNYIKVAKIRENSSLKIIFRHLLPNAIPSVIPRLTYNTTTLLFSTMVVEIVLNRSGLGTWVFSAFYQHDYVAISLAVLGCGVLTCLLTLLSEILVVVVYPIQSRALYE